MNEWRQSWKRKQQRLFSILWKLFRLYGNRNLGSTSVDSFEIGHSLCRRIIRGLTFSRFSLSCSPSFRLVVCHLMGEESESSPANMFQHLSFSPRNLHRLPASAAPYEEKSGFDIFQPPVPSPSPSQMSPPMKNWFPHKFPMGF